MYAITSLDPRHADPGLLAGWLRSHWKIENRLHRVRDVTQREDHASVRTGSDPQVIAALRNTAINLARLAGQTNSARAGRYYSNRPDACRRALHTA